MEEKILNAALAGLLHDVGKIEQRALAIPNKSAPGFEGEGQPAHATYSAYFVQTYVPKAYQAAALAGAYHHAPERSPGQEKALSKLVSLADKLSAGERVEPDENKQQPRQMISIFDRIALDAPRREKDWHFLPLRPLELAPQALFPGRRKDKDTEGDGYQVLLDSLTTAAQQDPGDLQSYVENMLGALQTAAWCVPSAYYYSAPDVSLYDHSRMTAALAVCMAGMAESEIDTLLDATRTAFQEKQELPDTPVALLVGGDISGIQKFIYTISSKKAAQTLRGRSFYLQLLTEAVLRLVLRELGLPYTNVIYSGGGHFFLLAPVDAKERLPEIRKIVTKKMLKHHGTSLYFALGSAEIPASGFKAGRFPEFWSRMHADLGRAKQRRYTELDQEIHSAIFAVPETGGNPDDTCSVCGGDALQTDSFVDYDERQARICTLCDSFAKDIGRNLPIAKFVALGWQNPEDTPTGTGLDALKAFGLQIQFLEKAIIKVNLKGIERITLWALDDPKRTWPGTGTLPIAHSLRYTVNAVPPMTLDELQDKVEGGFKRLGVLRMDVDNLGDVFKKGLGTFATLARLSTLSFQLSLYFEGWVKRICEDKSFGGNIYAVYAGGDDVFLLGPWDVMPDLALKIRNDFSEYTGRNPELHLSAGLAFIGGKYPIYQAAKEADEALQSAKHSAGKDAFGFIGTAWPWSEFEQVKAKFERIVRIVKELEGSQAVIQVLRDLTEQKAKKSEKTRNKDVWGPWQWHGAYLLKRMEEREKGRPELAREIKAIREELDEDNYSKLYQWGAAARWAQLKTRKKSKDTKESE
jgi:CRISPR-associated protein Csm1